MTTIRPLQRIMEVIRSKKMDKTSERNLNRSEIDLGAQSDRIQSLQNHIKNALQSINLSDESGRERARAVFIRSVLFHEWGEDIEKDPRYESLVEEIQQTLNQNTIIADQLNELLSEAQK